MPVIESAKLFLPHESLENSVILIRRDLKEKRSRKTFFIRCYLSYKANFLFAGREIKISLPAVVNEHEVIYDSGRVIELNNCFTDVTVIISESLEKGGTTDLSEHKRHAENI